MSSAVEQRYPVSQLSVGMYVTSLEMPAINNPFPLEGFYIKTLAEIEVISSYCSHALVNMTKTRCVQEFHCSLQMEVVDIDIVDIPKAIMRPKEYREVRRVKRAALKDKPAKKGNLSRLFFLLAVCIGVYQMSKL